MPVTDIQRKFISSTCDSSKCC